MSSNIESCLKYRRLTPLLFLFFHLLFKLVRDNDPKIEFMQLQIMTKFDGCLGHFLNETLFLYPSFKPTCTSSGVLHQI